MIQDNTHAEAIKTLIGEELNNQNKSLKSQASFSISSNLNYLKYVDWLLVGSLTWKARWHRGTSYQAELNRTNQFDSLIRDFCANFRLKHENLAYFKTNEFGTQNGPHTHFLIAADGCETLYAPECAEWLEAFWEMWLSPNTPINRKIKRAVIRPFGDTKNFPPGKYCLERDPDTPGKPWERFIYFSPRLAEIIRMQSSVS